MSAPPRRRSSGGSRQRRRTLRRRAWKRLGIAAALVATLVLLVVVPPAVFVGMNCSRFGGQGPVRSAEVLRVAADVKGYFRDEASTYLTVPRWSAVHSTDEYASFIERHPPSSFPYGGAIRQYWHAYASVCGAMRRAYPFDPGHHVMLAALGVGFSAENAVKGAYENTVGRLTEWIGSHRTEEDAFAQRTAREYGRAMRTAPWHEFPFGARLVGLWRDTPLWGPAVVRKWERKLALSAVYATKAVSAALIRYGTGAAYAADDLHVHAWVEGEPDAVFGDTRVGKVREAGAGSWIVLAPRHEFTDIASGLARRGARFRDIAGNEAIVMTVIVPREWHSLPDDGTLVFEAPLLTDPAARRVGLTAPVRSLHAVLGSLERRGARVEHLYAY